MPLLDFHATLADPGETASRLAAFIPGHDPLGAGALIRSGAARAPSPAG